MILRKLLQSDLPEILALEQASHVDPWTEDTFKMCFEPGYFCWVIELDRHIIGFIVFSCRLDECHVLNLCVVRTYQRKGFGGELLKKALSFAEEMGMRIVYLEVRRSNTRAISLYTKMQFQRIGERKGYYPTPLGPEDALVFAKRLDEGN